MIRSVCIITRDYPPGVFPTPMSRTFEALARGLAELGIAVHVITRDPINEGRLDRYQGVAVHRIRSYLCGSDRGPEIDDLLWAIAAGEHYRQIDSDVDFDIVLAPELNGEILKVLPGPHTALVVQLFGSPNLFADSEIATDPSKVISAAVELEALRRADAVIAPSAELARRVSDLDVGRRVHVLPVPFFSDKFSPTDDNPESSRLELAFHGPLAEGSGADLALEILAAVKRRGRQAHLSLVGEDSGAPFRYRRTELFTLMERLGLDFSEVRFLNELGSAGFARHLARADALLAPHSGGQVTLAPLEALAMDRPTLVSANEPVASWFPDNESVHQLPLGERERLIADGADFLMNLGSRSATTVPARVRGLFDPARVASLYIELFETIERRPRLDRRLREPARRAPKLGVVIPAYNAVAYTKRCIESLLEHTTVPMRLIVVDNASIDTTAALLTSIEDERLFPVPSTKNHGAAGGRNVGINYLDGDEDYVVFLDNDVEVLANWWVPFVEALDANPDVGLVGEAGMRAAWTDEGRVATEIKDEGIQPCEIIVGYCMFARASTVKRVGGFDERFGFLWHDDDDWTMRAARIGEGALRVPAEKVLHYEHRSSSTVDGVWDAPNVPSKLSEANLKYLAKKHESQELRPNTPFLVLADAKEAVDDPSLIATWAAAFTDVDEAALVLYGPGLDPIDYELRLAIASEQAGVDLEHGPRIIALLPPTVTDEEECTISDEIFAVLSNEQPTKNFLHIAWYRPEGSTSRELRLHAARMWSTRPVATAPIEARLPATQG